MKLTVAAAALALAIGTAASAFAAPPAPTTTPAVHAAAPMAAKPVALKADGTIKTLSAKGFTLNSGKAFKFDAGFNASALKAGQKVKVHYEMKNHQRWATEVTPS